jgi:hypothetical protein
MMPLIVRRGSPRTTGKPKTSANDPHRNSAHGLSNVVLWTELWMRGENDIV